MCHISSTSMLSFLPKISLIRLPFGVSWVQGTAKENDQWQENPLYNDIPWHLNWVRLSPPISFSPPWYKTNNFWFLTIATTKTGMRHEDHTFFVRFGEGPPTSNIFQHVDLSKFQFSTAKSFNQTRDHLGAGHVYSELGTYLMCTYMCTMVRMLILGMGIRFFARVASNWPSILMWRGLISCSKCMMGHSKIDGS